MNKQYIRKSLAELFEAAGRAHHEAFIETDGDDPEWPLWYASYLQDRLTAILSHELTKSEIVYSLVLLSREQPVAAPDTPWSEYYADYYVEHYLE